MDEQYLDILDLGDAIRKRYRMILLIMSIAIAGAIAGTYLPSQKYEATAKLLFPQGGVAGIAAVAASLGVGAGVQNPIDTYQEILQSRPIIEKVARRTNLTLEEAEDAVRISGKKDAGIIEIQARGRTPAEAAWIANSYRWALEDMDRKLKLSSITPEISFVQAQLEKSKADFDKAQEKLRRFQEEHRILSSTGGAGGTLSSGIISSLSGITSLSNIAGVPSLATPTVTGTMYAYDDQLRGVEIQLRDIEARIQQFKAKQEHIISQATELPADMPLAQKWREQLTQKEYDLAVARHQYGESHPKVVLLNKDIAEIKKQLFDEVARSRKALEQGLMPELVSFEIEKVALQAKRAALTKLVTQGPGLDEQMNRLVQEVQFQANLYSTLRAQYVQFEMDRQRSPNRWEVLQDAVPPEKPFRSIMLNLALGVIVGGALSWLAVLYANHLEQARLRKRSISTG